MLVDFCLPVKNEEKILRANLEKLLLFCNQASFNFEWRIVGVVNGSTDASAAIFQEFKERFPAKIDYLEISEPGRGNALKEYWRLSQADILSYMDSDLAVDLRYLPFLIGSLLDDECDLAIGSRLLSASETKRSGFRELVSRVYNLISRLLLRHKISDLQCGFKAIKKPVFMQLEKFFLSPHRFTDKNWFFDTELVVLARRLGFRIKEVPVDWQENRYQKRSSKVKIFRDVWFFMANILVLRKHLQKIKKYPGNDLK